MMREPIWFGFLVSFVMAGVFCYLKIWGAAVVLAFVCGAYFTRLHDRKPSR